MGADEFQARPDAEQSEADGWQPGPGDWQMAADEWQQEMEERLLADRAAFAQGPRTSLPICIVFGNCQSEALRRLLADSPAFAAEYELVPVPLVHAIAATERAALEQLVARASLIVIQPIRDGYRNLALGTSEITAAAPPQCRVIRVPVLFYRGLFPFQTFVHLDGRSVATPMTKGRHDRRIIYCAGQGLDAHATVEWLAAHLPDAAPLRRFAAAVAADLRERERNTDVPMIDRIIADPELHGRSFFTLNHPARGALRLVSESVHQAVGIPFADTGSAELLDWMRTPVEKEVLAALGVPGEGTTEWRFAGRAVPMRTVVEQHLAYYRRRPEILAAALAEHAGTLARLPVVGLTG